MERIYDSFKLTDLKPTQDVCVCVCEREAFYVTTLSVAKCTLYTADGG